MKLDVDPQSPVPLYHQIAEAIRAAIVAGELAPGDALDPMRRAAERWGVHVHTIRHAYAALAREGLVELRRGPGGTRVIGAPDSPSTPTVDTLQGFLEEIEGQAARRFGLSPTGLLAVFEQRLRRNLGERPVVYVVECSEWQCESHAREIEARFAVEAVPWPLQRGEPPEGVVVSTYFHYNDIRRQWPRRLEAVRFVTIYPDPTLRETLADAPQVVVCERDPDTAETVASDLLALFPADGPSPEIHTRVLAGESPRLPDDDGPPIFFAPRVWAELDPNLRQHPRAHELRYVFDPAELAAVGQTASWSTTKEPRGVHRGSSSA